MNSTVVCLLFALMTISLIYLPKILAESNTDNPNNDSDLLTSGQSIDASTLQPRNVSLVSRWFRLSNNKQNKNKKCNGKPSSSVGGNQETNKEKTCASKGKDCSETIKCCEGLKCQNDGDHAVGFCVGKCAAENDLCFIDSSDQAHQCCKGLDCVDNKCGCGKENDDCGGSGQARCCAELNLACSGKMKCTDCVNQEGDECDKMEKPCCKGYACSEDGTCDQAIGDDEK